MAVKEVLFDHGPLRGGTLFRAPEAIIRADAPEEVPAAFAAMETARGEGYWLAGYASYELGYLMDARLRPLLPAARPEPLMLFGVFARPEPAQGWLAAAAEEAGRGRIGDWRPDWGRADYG
ncbi:aminodeoxychorismate synthase component I, partial [Thioclava sp. BHET1]